MCTSNIDKDHDMPRTPSIVHYCAASYSTGSIGGVARFDDHIRRAFPERIFIQSSCKSKLEDYLRRNPDTIVITDNQWACHVPRNIRTIIFHHGSARTSWERNHKNGKKNGFYRVYVEPQERMLTYRDPCNTIIASISTACTEYFTNYYTERYTRFERYDIFHTSEFSESEFKTRFNTSPVVLGNWLTANKGKNVIPALRSSANEFKFVQLNIRPTGLGAKEIDRFTWQKQSIYNNADIFLQISNSEGNSYASLDALICGLPIVASNVGLFYKDVPEDCFVKMDWRKNQDVKYVKRKLLLAWKNREQLSKNARAWYIKNYRYVDWLAKVRKMVNTFATRTNL